MPLLVSDRTEQLPSFRDEVQLYGYRQALPRAYKSRFPQNARSKLQHMLEEEGQPEASDSRGGPSQLASSLRCKHGTSSLSERCRKPANPRIPFSFNSTASRQQVRLVKMSGMAEVHAA